MARLRDRPDDAAPALRAQRKASGGPMKKLRLLALMDEELVPPDDVRGVDVSDVEWKTEFDVVSTLRELGHEVQCLGVRSDLGVIRTAVDRAAAARGLQPARGLPRRADLRPERGELPRAAATCPTPAATRAA